MRKMMSKEYTSLYVGTAREIKSLYNNLIKKDLGYSVFVYEPRFNMSRMYGLYLTYYDEYTECLNDVPEISILSADTVCELLVE